MLYTKPQNEKKKKRHFKESFLVPSGPALASLHVSPQLIPLLCAQGMRVNVFHSQPDMPDSVSAPTPEAALRRLVTLHGMHGGRPNSTDTQRRLGAGRPCHQLVPAREAAQQAILVLTAPTTPLKTSLNPKQS